MIEGKFLPATHSLSFLLSEQSVQIPEISELVAYMRPKTILTVEDFDTRSDG